MDAWRARCTSCAGESLEDGESVTERFGYSEDDAYAVGLTCGGVIDILVTPVLPGSPVRTVLAAALAAAARGETAAVARVAEGPAELMGRVVAVRGDGSYEGGLGAHPELDRTVAEEARAMLDAGRTGVLEIGADGLPAESRSRCSSSPASRLRG